MALTCEACGREFARGSGLASHRRARHPGLDGGRQAAALEQTVALLEQSGRLERVDRARVEALRGLASAVDERPHDAQLWRQYREALGEVLDADRRADDKLHEAVDAIRGAASVGDAASS